MDLIQNVLKPRYVKPPKEDEPFNYITGIQAKWFRNNFYFVATYAMRYTGKEWVGVFDALTVDECMTAIRDDPWFEK